MAIGKKDGVVTKSLVTPRRPNQRAIDAAFELLHVAVWPGDAQRCNKVRATSLWRDGTASLQLFVDSLHSRPKIPVRTGPSGRMYAGRAAQGIDCNPRVYRK